VADLFTDHDKFMVPSGPRALEPLRDGIEVRGLRFSYRDGVPVLGGVDAVIPAGKVTAIVGASGSGKSTLVGLIARLYDCPPGQILLDGVDVREFSLSSLHRRMTLVSQEVWLLHRTLRENLTFGLDRAVTDAELVDALTALGLGPFLSGLEEGLDTLVGDRGVRLSGGQRQRIALARALLRGPEILILDEATSALDSVGEARVAEALRQRLTGRTLIVIAHRLSTIRDADQILVMRDGDIVERGTWARLAALGGVFTELQNAQFEDDASVDAGAR
jgi:ABC-type multidrug transport system fused ATPase/permease subunit